ncbi:hypothetical protein BKA56DRAFT_181024 [Ilyonectria sp. MPI-CAGE-AT-0026]|nr:hypothetical protein BKA56DRAFT_181024 [Ilyonectria sp. MPI-CAGE-AT-0026]
MLPMMGTPISSTAAISEVLPTPWDNLLFTCRSGTAQRSSTAQRSRAASGSGSGSWPTARQQTPSLPPSLPSFLPLSPLSVGCAGTGEREEADVEPIHPSIASHLRSHPPSSILHPPPHLRSYPRERLGTGNKTEHDAQLEGRIEMGMGINHVWSTGSHASGAEQARPEEARAERDTVTEAGAASSSSSSRSQGRSRSRSRCTEAERGSGRRREAETVACPQGKPRSLGLFLGAARLSSISSLDR